MCCPHLARITRKILLPFRAPPPSLAQSNFSSTPGAVDQWRFSEGSPSGARPSSSMTQGLDRFSQGSVSSPRRGSDTSDSTAYEADRRQGNSRFSLSSYNHPYEIQPPPGAYGYSPQETGYFARAQASKSEFEAQKDDDDIEKAIPETSEQLPRKRRGYLTNLIDLYNAYDGTEGDSFDTEQRRAIMDANRRTSGLVDPLAYNDDQILDPDDPLITGIRKKCLEDEDDVEKNALRIMNYKDRRKHRERIRIEFNVSCA